MGKKILHRSWPGIILSAAFLGAALLSRAFNRPLYRDFYQIIFTSEFALLAIFGCIFAASKGKKLPFHQNVAVFFSSYAVLTLCILTVFTLVMWIISGDKPETDSSDESAPASVGASKDDDPEDENTAEPVGYSPEQDSGAPHLSMTDWENDPFLLNMDNYCGYHVEEAAASELIFLLLLGSQSEIKVRGPYSSDSLNGANSPYADYIRRANELHSGYQLFSDNDLLLDYQIQLLEDEIETRKLADELFHVSNNQTIIGDNYVRLGNIYKQENNVNKAHECYAEAFGAYEAAYRTGIAEGADEDSLQSIVDRINNTSDKLTALTEMDTRQQAMAPKVAAAFTRLLAS